MTLKERATPRTAVRNAILMAGRSGRAVPAELMRLTGLPLPSVMTHLRSLEKDGEAFRDGRSWRIGRRPAEQPKELVLTQAPAGQPGIFD